MTQKNYPGLLFSFFLSGASAPLADRRRFLLGDFVIEKIKRGNVGSRRFPRGRRRRRRRRGRRGPLLAAEEAEAAEGADAAQPQARKCLVCECGGFGKPPLRVIVLLLVPRPLLA